MDKEGEQVWEIELDAPDTGVTYCSASLQGTDRLLLHLLVVIEEVRKKMEIRYGKKPDSQSWVWYNWEAICKDWHWLQGHHIGNIELNWLALEWTTAVGIKCAEPGEMAEPAGPPASTPSYIDYTDLPGLTAYLRSMEKMATLYFDRVPNLMAFALLTPDE